MPVTVAGTQITFNDSSTQSTAARGGSTTNTYTSGTTNFTLTSASTAQQRFVSGVSNPTNPLVTLPNMTTLPAGPSIFNFINAYSGGIGAADASGTVREIVPSGFVVPVDIWSNATSNGAWATSMNPLYNAYSTGGVDQTLTGFKVTAGTIFAGGFVRLSTTEFAYVWGERTSNNMQIYAKLYTINATTNAVTAGNTVTIGTALGIGGGSSPSITAPAYDCDFAGRALVHMGINASSGAAGTGYSFLFGLVASGGVLYATTPVTNSAASQDAGCGSWWIGQGYGEVGYLGSNNAFAVLRVARSNTGTKYISCYTLTGTTSPVLTAGSGAVTVGLSNNNDGGIWRISQSSWFVLNSNNAGNTVYVFSAAGNSLSTYTLTSASQMSEITAFASFGSIAQYGFMYNSSTGQCVYGSSAFTLSNAGTASATISIATNTKYKTYLTGDYLTNTAGSLIYAVPGAATSVARNTARKIGVFNPGGTIFSVHATGSYAVSLSTTNPCVFSVNTGSSTLDTNYSNYQTANVTAGVDILMSDSCGLVFNITNSNQSFTVRFVRVASPFTA